MGPGGGSGAPGRWGHDKKVMGPSWGATEL